MNFIGVCQFSHGTFATTLPGSRKWAKINEITGIFDARRKKCG